MCAWTEPVGKVEAKPWKEKLFKRWSCHQSNCPLVRNGKKITLIQMFAPISVYRIDARDKLCNKERNLSFFFNIGKTS